MNVAESEKREISNAKALKEKAELLEVKAYALRAKAHARRGKSEMEAADPEETERKRGEQDDEDEETGDYAKRLLAAYNKLKSSKDLSYQCVVCPAKPRFGLMVAKRITAEHKKVLSKVTGGSKRFVTGTCWVAGRGLTFEMEEPPPGLARKLQESIKYFTGKKIPIMVGDESADDEQDPRGITLG